VGSRSLGARYGNGGARNKISFDAFGHGLSGRSEPIQKSVIQSRIGRSAISDDIDLEDIESSSPHHGEGQIQVVTVVEQEVEKRRRSKSDADSTKTLVRGDPYR